MYPLLAETDTVLAKLSPALNEREREMFCAAAIRAAAEATTSEAAWLSLLEHLSNPLLSEEYISSPLRDALVMVFNANPPPPPRVHSAACAVLIQATRIFGIRTPARSSDGLDRDLCVAVLSNVCRGGALGLQSIGAATVATVGFAWPRAFLPELRRMRPRAMRCALDALDARDLCSADFAAASRLIRVLADAGGDSAGSEGGKDATNALRKEAVSPSEQLVKSMSHKGVQDEILVRESDVRVILRALERLGGDRSSASAVEESVLALAALARHDAEVAATVVMEQGAAVSDFFYMLCVRPTATPRSDR
jgi:hypothetical protein